MDAQSVFSAGLICGTFFHFFVNDQKGPIGILLRQLLTPLRNEFMDGLDDHDLGVIIVGLVMQIIGILQSPLCYGSNFDPFAYFFMGGEAHQPAVDKMPPLIEEQDKKSRARKHDVSVLVHENDHHHKRVMSKDEEENPKEKDS
jgi:hypothetical protein